MNNDSTQSNPTQLAADTLEERGLAWNAGPPLSGSGLPPRATYTAEEVARLLGTSTWAIYNSVKSGTCPVTPLRVGRRLIWPRSKVEQALGLVAVRDEAA